MTTYRQDAAYISENLPNVMLVIGEFWWWPTETYIGNFQPKVHMKGCTSWKVKPEWWRKGRKHEAELAESLPEGWAICQICATRALIDANETRVAA